MTTTVRWHAVADLADLARQANTQILAIAEEAIAERGHFSIVLAGGDTPRPIYRRLRGAFTDWKRWDIYFGDERCLPADDSGRNSHMASSEWLDHVALAPSRIHRIAAEQGAQAAAAAYAQTLSSVGAFDMVLLGLGEDGHTASLFRAMTLAWARTLPMFWRCTTRPSHRPSAFHSARRVWVERAVFSFWWRGRPNAKPLPTGVPACPFRPAPLHRPAVSMFWSRPPCYSLTCNASFQTQDDALSPSAKPARAPPRCRQ